MAILNVRSLCFNTIKILILQTYQGIFTIHKSMHNVNEDNELNPTNSKNKIKINTLRENIIRGFYIPTALSC